jgi:hypothetical protein
MIFSILLESSVINGLTSWPKSLILIQIFCGVFLIFIYFQIFFIVNNTIMCKTTTAIGRGYIIRSTWRIIYKLKSRIGNGKTILVGVRLSVSLIGRTRHVYGCRYNRSNNLSIINNLLLRTTVNKPVSVVVIVIWIIDKVIIIVTVIEIIIIGVVIIRNFWANTGVFLQRKILIINFFFLFLSFFFLIFLFYISWNFLIFILGILLLFRGGSFFFFFVIIVFIGKFRTIINRGVLGPWYYLVINRWFNVIIVVILIYFQIIVLDIYFHAVTIRIIIVTIILIIISWIITA